MAIGTVLLKLDDKEISTREYGRGRLLLPADRRDLPALGSTEGEGGINKKRIKVSRLACIENEQESCSDLGSVSCDNEIRSRDENIIYEDEAEIVDLMKRVEQLRKDRSILWLREFKDWMDHTSENFADGGNFNVDMLHLGNENYKKAEKSERHLSESSRYVSDLVQASGDKSSMHIFESDNSFADTFSSVNANRYFGHIFSSGITAGSLYQA